MTNRERVLRTFRRQKIDRLPVIEIAPYWDKTIERWKADGLKVPENPNDIYNYIGLYDYLGVDPHVRVRLIHRKPNFPKPVYGEGYITCRQDYLDLKKYLYPDFDPASMIGPNYMEIKKLHDAGEVFLWICPDGFFWYPRYLFGITEHLYAFYDHPDIIKEICEDLALYMQKLFADFSQVMTPDLIIFAEDMSYNHGSMISKDAFDEFVAPYYKMILPGIKALGIMPFIDSDGNVADLIPWFKGIGLEGITPLERQAGVDIVAYKRDYPDFNMFGAFDKTIMHLGIDVLQKEFERIFPVMCSGGYIPSCDHQTPPAVSLEDYRLYTAMLREYCYRAVQK